MANYRLSKEAIKDLSNIWNFTFEIWSENQANKYYGQIKEGFREISIDPEIGRNFIGVDKSFLGYHVNRHIIFYRKHKTKRIEIVRILHEKMDIPNRMR